ncbi:hypothetical protein HF1_04280 [Mycoplasma haemofelis str. Langford 1]|uniref:Uncharacterized protein n=1 Tax=Mycoplasma haemofelis (strain Langford 1) TaxID=941640 RepID=E8ZH15_MYCHL|nr:hypothetical protein [Mycoplasma haemofelis]CBY92436.1 hypothetical protein HF1_04280 [Mycoplasma haemofelis str. Langford 1]
MNKLLFMGAGAVGAGGLGLGGYSLLKPNKETFRNKFSNSLLNKDSDSEAWNSRYSSLKGQTPAFPSLLEVAKKNDDLQTTKEAHKRACLEIYDSPVEDNKYLRDFELYCSKHIEDEITKSSLISDAKNVGTEWDKRLDALKKLTGDAVNTLSDELKSLKTTMGSSNASDDYRDTLKKWCDTTKTKIFLGSEDLKFKDVKTYCVKNNV